MTKLASMMNIGQEMEKKLTAVGISSAEELMDLGAEEAFRRLKTAYPQVCLVHLYALEGAVSQTEYNGLSRDRKRALKAFSEFLQSGR